MTDQIFYRLHWEVPNKRTMIILVGLPKNCLLPVVVDSVLGLSIDSSSWSGKGASDSDKSGVLLLNVEYDWSVFSSPSRFGLSGVVASRTIIVIVG